MCGIFATFLACVHYTQVIITSLLSLEHEYIREFFYFHGKSKECRVHNRCMTNLGNDGSTVLKAICMKVFVWNRKREL